MFSNLLAHMAKLVVSQQNAMASEEQADAEPDVAALLRVLTPDQPAGHIKQKALTMILDRATGTVRSSIKSL